MCVWLFRSVRGLSPSITTDLGDLNKTAAQRMDNPFRRNKKSTFLPCFKVNFSMGFSEREKSRPDGCAWVVGNCRYSDGIDSIDLNRALLIFPQHHHHCPRKNSSFYKALNMAPSHPSLLFRFLFLIVKKINHPNWILTTITLRVKDHRRLLPNLHFSAFP